MGRRSKQTVVGSGPLPGPLLLQAEFNKSSQSSEAVISQDSEGVTEAMSEGIPTTTSAKDCEDDEDERGSVADFLNGLGMMKTPPQAERNPKRSSCSGDSSETSQSEEVLEAEQKSDLDGKVRMDVEETGESSPAVVVTTEQQSPHSKEKEDANAGSVNQVEKEEEKCGQQQESANVEIAGGKLRSAVAEMEGRALAAKYKDYLQDTEEYALQYMSQELSHPVISCFRELTKSDVSSIVSSGKLKKSLNSLERSVVYLGLLDFLATTNNNPLYGDNCNAKLSKNISGPVQKILLEFKNILGTWALSGNEELLSRYKLVMNYFRTVAPMFTKSGFEQGFTGIIDCIEREVGRHKSNQEKLRDMRMSNAENAGDKKQAGDVPEDSTRSALNEIVLNVSLNIKEDDSEGEDNDVSVVAVASSPKIFGKPLRPSPKSSGSVKKTSKSKPAPRVSSSLSINNGGGGANKSGTTQLQQNGMPKTPTSHIGTSKANLPQPRTLTSVFLSSKSESSNKANNNNGSVKRNAEEDSVAGSSGSVKKPKLEHTTPVTSSPAAAPTVKPIVNAFALMMSKSRELAQKKKEKLKSSHHVSSTAKVK